MTIDPKQVLQEAEHIRSNGTGAAPTQASAAPAEGAAAGPSAAVPPPAWEQYQQEGTLCAMYADQLLRHLGCNPLSAEENAQAVQAWAELLAKWFPSVKEFMGPEVRLLTIYGLPIAGRFMSSWMSVPSPESSADVGAEKPLS